MRVRAYLRGMGTDVIVRRVVRGVKTVDKFSIPGNLGAVIDAKSSWVLVELTDADVAAMKKSIENRVVKARKVTPEIMAQINDLLGQGMRMKVVEERFKVTRQTIYNHRKKAAKEPQP